MDLTSLAAGAVLMLASLLPQGSAAPQVADDCCRPAAACCSCPGCECPCTDGGCGGDDCCCAQGACCDGGCDCC